jgi:hypothetical protein
MTTFQRLRRPCVLCAMSSSASNPGRRNAAAMSYYVSPRRQAHPPQRAGRRPPSQAARTRSQRRSASSSRGRQRGSYPTLFRWRRPHERRFRRKRLRIGSAVRRRVSGLLETSNLTPLAWLADLPPFFHASRRSGATRATETRLLQYMNGGQGASHVPLRSHPLTMHGFFTVLEAGTPPHPMPVGDGNRMKTVRRWTSLAIAVDDSAYASCGARCGMRRILPVLAPPIVWRLTNLHRSYNLDFIHFARHHLRARPPVRQGPTFRRSLAQAHV